MVYSNKHNGGKGYRDSVGIEEYRSKYRLNLARKHSRVHYGTEQKRIATGLSISTENLAAVEAKAQQIHLDLLAGHFDSTLIKYGLAKEQPQLALVASKPKQMGLLKLYDWYCESRKNLLAPTTYELLYKRVFRNAILEATLHCNENDSLAIRNYLLEHRSARRCKEILSILSKAYKLGIRETAQTGITHNPYEGESEQIEIKQNKRTQDNFDDENEDTDKRAYSVAEMNAIIEAFESRKQISHFAPIIKFLFLTGCRTGEAAGFKWRDVKWDKEIICIRRSYNRNLRLFKPTKTGSVRFIPIPKDGLLWNLLKSIPERDPDDVVFMSKTGKIINTKNLGDVWRGKRLEDMDGVIPTLIKQGKIADYLTLYATRHTFYSHQVHICNIKPEVVSAWIGNSADVGRKHYLDRDRVTVPGNPNAMQQQQPDVSTNQLFDTISKLTPEQKEQLKALLQ